MARASLFLWYSLSPVAYAALSSLLRHALCGSQGEVSSSWVQVSRRMGKNSAIQIVLRGAEMPMGKRARSTISSINKKAINSEKLMALAFTTQNFGCTTVWRRVPPSLP